MTDDRLNEEQLAAVEADGEVFVSAGAGTGKTAVLVERFVRAVCERGVDVDSILVITYTRKAAAELRGRIRGELQARGRADLARALDGAWISTIHSFCSRLLRAYPFAAGLDPRFRELDEAQAAVLRSEAFETALAGFCVGEEPERLQLLATYGAAGLRRMLTGVYETLRSAGRELVLELGEPADLDERLEELAEAARCLAGETAATDAQRTAATQVLELLAEPRRPERLLDLTEFRCSGERAASYEEARKAVEQAALDRVASADRALLQDLLQRFAAAYAAAKRAESAVDFEDLQLETRDLLARDERIREREQLRFRSIMVDEFQDTNRLQCELVDLLSGRWPATSEPAEPAPPAPDVADGTSLSGAVQSTVPSGDAPSATPHRREVRASTADLFYVGDEFQSIYGFRHADVAVFRERRSQAPQLLPLTRNYRSRPQVLAAVNELFGSHFGDEFQPLAASGSFPDPAGHPVELLVTDKESYSGSGVHWRRAEARHIARRVRELVDSGAAAPGEIVLLFAAGTDAEWYEEELRQAGLPTYRATGRGYFGQQQVVDVLAYLRLLRNRYDDRALLTVLASPLVGVSNDTLALLRRSASRRPLFSGLERDFPPGLAADDERLLRAFRQRYERLAAAQGRLSLEQLCEQVVAAHDYDLAVIAQWDGRRRYANIRKLARLARSYEELRGNDLEGFVQFVADQDALGSSERDAVAEEEGADAVRLSTIHGVKGLEFKVVIVADAGRGAPPPTNEILALPDGRFGFQIVDPVTSKRRGAFDWDELRKAQKASEEAEKLRLYYVAMTRAIDRLLVSGAVDPEKSADISTPIGWVLSRLEAHSELEGADSGPLELERGEARLLIRVDRHRPEAVAAAEVIEPVPARAEDSEPAQLALFAELPDDGAEQAPPLPVLPVLPALPAPPLHRPRRLSFTALAQFGSCSYKYYALRVAGLKELPAAREAPEGAGALAATEIGDAVHRLLEATDLAAPAPPELEQVRGWYPTVSEEELARIGRFVAAYCESEQARRVAALAGVRKEQHFTFEHVGVLLHGFLDVFQLADGRALVLDYKTNALGESAPADIVEADYRLQRLVYALAAFRAGAEEVEVVYQFLERPDAVAATTFARAQVPELEAELAAAIEAIHAAEFRPTPSEWACVGCPALDLVCAGPRLRGGRAAAAPVAPVPG